jgi:hypothetical protein
LENAPCSLQPSSLSQESSTNSQLIPFENLPFPSFPKRG